MRTLGVYVFLAICSTASAQTAGDSNRTIAPIEGNLYRAQDGTRTTVFYVTPEGILLADPLDREFSVWLKGELNARFPGRAVKYVVNTSLEFDRAGGGGEFTGTAELVSSDAFKAELAAVRGRLPRRLAAMDGNRSGVLESTELTNIESPERILRRDLNGDGNLTATELWGATAIPERTYRDRRTITLGTRQVVLVRSHRHGSTMLYFPDERTVFAADYPSSTAPFGDPTASAADIAAWARIVTSLEFDRLVGGNGETIARLDVTKLADYVEQLVAAVSQGYDDGRSVDQIQNSRVLARFSGTPYERTRNLDVVSVYRTIQVVALDAYGAALASFVAADLPYCGTHGACSLGRKVGAGAFAGGGVSVKQFRAAGELSWREQLNAVYFDPNTTKVGFAHRDVVLSAMVGFRTAPSRRVTITALAGPAFGRAHKANVELSPFRDPYVMKQSKSRLGFTFGADVAAPLSRRIAVVIPLRFTRLLRDPDDLFSYDTTRDVRVGAGLTVKLARLLR